MLRDLYKPREGKRMRASSYDRTGGNFDFYTFNAGERKTIFDVETPGCITHIWVTMGTYPHRPEAMLERKVVLRMYWDSEETPSVEAPIGDFFGMGHGMSKNFVSVPLTMSPQDGRGYNCYFPMPFSSAARIEVVNEADEMIMFYYYVDYEEYKTAPDSPLRFHAQWRRELTQGIDDSEVRGEEFQFSGYNNSIENNYVILDARGKGHYVGCNLNIHNLRYTNDMNWPGEGDDMIVIDDEPWPPRLHGTGCEDYFGTAFCPLQEYNAPFHGIILPGGENWFGKITYYRYHVLDPIMFEKSIKVTIEHGHNNNRSDDYSSTAYWYQTEPHVYHPILPVEQRMPLPDIRRNPQTLFRMKGERDAYAKKMGIE
jgi:hypothetical protein